MFKILYGIGLDGHPAFAVCAREDHPARQCGKCHMIEQGEALWEAAL